MSRLGVRYLLWLSTYSVVQHEDSLYNFYRHSSKPHSQPRAAHFCAADAATHSQAELTLHHLAAVLRAPLEPEALINPRLLGPTSIPLVQWPRDGASEATNMALHNGHATIGMRTHRRLDVLIKLPGDSCE